MKLSQFSNLLQTYPDRPFHLILPGLNTVPVSFHITEVGHIQKTFIDCGGKLHRDQTCLLQAWVSTDTDHRLLAGKMADVLSKSEKILPVGEDLDVEIEYEDTVISQYPVTGHTVTDHAILFTLAAKHTDCLAKSVCLPMAMASSCCGTSCDCG